ncbi:hypothetical protein O0L34_g1387 [Tuta absoluta]|nr:hypothetical protein O0L34_g1387 [Tuta absoluta]
MHARTVPQPMHTAATSVTKLSPCLHVLCGIIGPILVNDLLNVNIVIRCSVLKKTFKSIAVFILKKDHTGVEYAERHLSILGNSIVTLGFIPVNGPMRARIAIRLSSSLAN